MKPKSKKPYENDVDPSRSREDETKPDRPRETSRSTGSPHWTEEYEVWSDDASCEDCDATFNDAGAREEQEAAMREHAEETGHVVGYYVTLRKEFTKEVVPVVG